MNLLPYQKAAIAAVGGARRAGHRRILLASPTGSGKTVLLSRLTQLAVAQAKRCLWLVNRRELVTQTVRTLAAFGIDAGHSGANLSAMVQVRTYQGALAAGEVPPADVLFPDEAHHLAGTGEWISIMRAYPAATVIGATATPERSDGKGLCDAFDHLITVAQAADLVTLWEQTGGTRGLVPCHVIRPGRELNGLARTPAKATVMHKLRDHRQVCFAPHIKAAEEYVRQYREIGMGPALVTGATPVEERDAIFMAFRAGLVNPLVGCQVFTEGWDEPSVEVVTLAGKCGSIGAMIQKVGRGLRPYPWKTRCIVLDLFGITHTLGHPTADRVFSLEGDGISGPPVERIRLSLCKRCGGEMLDDSDTCPRDGCGWTRPGLEVPKEVNERLERWEWRRTQGDEERVTRMAQWIREDVRRGKEPRKALAIAIMKYAGYYHVEKVPKSIIGQASAMANGRPWCPKCQHSVRDVADHEGVVTARCKCLAA